IGVTLAGAGEPAARAVQHVVCGAPGGASGLRRTGCAILGTNLRADPGNAALANGTAAHALDYDDMCFVSLAHPSAPLVAAGLAARNGVLAAQLARAGMTASNAALTGAQGFIAAMDGRVSGVTLDDTAADLGDRWEILDTGITVKLYPSCAATHPMLDVLLK